MMRWINQLFCALRGHGGVNIQPFERYFVDHTEGGHRLICKKCGKTWEEINYKRIKL